MYKQIKLLDHHIIAGEDSLSVFQTLFDSGDYKNRSFFILVDQNTEKYCLNKLKQHIPPDQKPKVISIPAGEKHKTIEYTEKIWQFLTTHYADRGSVLINLGGGVTTDIGGFAASTFKRGISFINIPTSLTGMVDAAIGGKTGVNFNGIKNMVGLFRQPDSIYIYPGFLETLPANETKSGYAEILKYALINDKNLWDVMKNKQIRDFKSLEDLIIFSILIKSEIVEQDPEEMGLRKTLNFGHTFGHAFETFWNNMGNPTSHGAAIAAGIICESYLSAKINHLKDEDLKEIQATIHKNYSWPTISKNNIPELIQIMHHDKKNQHTKVNCSLLDMPGQCKYDQLIPYELLVEALNHFINE
ncbi:MAG: 3-dehydroquinate synthase [Bacteroidales bacterium]